MDTRVLAGLLYLDEADPHGLRVKFRMAEDSVTFSTAQEMLGTWTPLGTEVEEVGTERFRLRLGSDLVVFAPDDPVEFKYEIAPQLGDRSRKRSRRMGKKLRAVVDGIDGPTQALGPPRELAERPKPETDPNGRRSAGQKAEPAKAQLVKEEPSPVVVPPEEKVAKSKTASSRPAIKPEPPPAPVPKTKQETPASRTAKPQAAAKGKPGQRVAPSAAASEPKPVQRTETKPVPKTEPRPVPKIEPRPVPKIEPKPVPKVAPVGPRTVIEPRAAQERSAVEAVAHEPMPVPKPSQPEPQSIPVRSPGQAQDLMGDVKRRLGRREPSAPHRHSFSTSGVPGGLVRFVCTGCGHVSIDLTSEPATTERKGSLFRKGVRL